MSLRLFPSLHRSRLMLGVSAGALMLAAPGVHAEGNPFARIANPTLQAAQAAGAKATQTNAAAATSQRALAAFAQAAAIRRNLDTIQASARAVAAAKALGVPDGLGAGGLQVDPGVAGDPSLWLNADAPTQSTGADGRTQVDITQTDRQAILNWKSFNVGLNTDLRFDQQSSSWVVLNRVTDPLADPTRILGAIKAPGTVLIMNRNGVIFGGASQVDVGGLIAGAARISDAQFLKNGIYSTLSGLDYAPVFTDALGQVKVEAGAQLTTSTPASVLQGGGAVMLIGGSVENDGVITTPKGQTLLAAGDSFAVRTGLGSTSNAYSTTRGSEIAPTIAADSANGVAINTGEITAQQGDITLAGRTVTQAGVALSTSTVSTRGTIHLLNSASDAKGSVTLTGDSYTAVLPELDSTETALDSQRDALIADSALQNQARLTNNAEFDNLSKQADREDQGRIEIVSGGSVQFQGGSLTQAQGGQIAASAAGRVQVDAGATLDVSGVQNVALDVASNNILINIQGNELRDSPVNRDAGTLFNSDVWVDARDLIEVPAGTGSGADRWYTAGGLIEVSGYVANTGHGIGEWDAVGGVISFSAAEVVAQSGSLFNLAGGSLAYQGGDVKQTLLQGADGKMYTADNAPANIQMVSVGKSFQVLHPRWGVQYTETWQSPFTQTEIVRHEDSYLVGRDAGQLVLSAPTVLFEGDIDAEVFTGELQVNAHPQGATDGYKLGQTQAPLTGGINIGDYIATGLFGGFDTDVKIGADIPDAASGLALSDPIADDRQNTAWLDAGRLSSQGLGRISVATAGGVTVDAPLTLANGGALTLIGSTVDVDADITARSGSISLSNFIKLSTALGGGVVPFLDADGGAHATVGKGVTLDLRGLWVNAVTDPDTASDLAFVDGGDLTVDTTQDVTIGEGSVIDVSSGGGLTVAGKAKGGRGGDVTLVAGDPITNNGGPASTLTLNGVIHAEGVTGGGTLTLSEPGTVLIGDDASLSGGQLTLAAGTPAHVNLTLAEALTIPAGQPLPMPFTEILSRIPLDTVLTQQIAAIDQRTPDSGQVGIRTQADWVVPQGLEVDNFLNTFQTYFAGSTVPAGTNISFMTGTFPAGTVIPSAVFPNGFPVKPYTSVTPIGGVLAKPITYAAGTVVPAGTVFAVAAPILPVTTLNTDIFKSGFANYVINGGSGVLVSAGTVVAPEVPLYQIDGDSLSVRSGADPASAMSSWTPPLFLENPQAATLTQRQGASLTLTSLTITGIDQSGGAIVVPEGASITVDPGQNIKLDAFGQITVEGDLIAHGGKISLINEATGATEPGRQFDQSGNTRATSIWVGGHALLDVSGEAYSAKDRYGRAYGLVTNGGAIDIGGSMIVDPNGHPLDTTSFVIVRPGAELNADGAQIVIDPLAGAGASVSGKALNVASNGGSIVMDSFSGLYLDGNIHAFAGGAGAGGGSLSLTLELPVFNTAFVIQPFDLPVGAMTVVQARPDSPLPADIAPGTDPKALTLGQTTVSADMIEAGGFDNVALTSRDLLLFSGDVSLKASQSVTLTAVTIISALPTVSAGPFMTDPDAPVVVPTGQVKISAPYVLFNQPGQERNDNTLNSVIGAPSVGRLPENDASFEVDADQIDFQGGTIFGGNIFFSMASVGFVNELAPGFEDIKFNSQGDIRFLAASPLQGATTSLVTGGDLSLVAAQIYPATNAQVYVAGGADGTGTLTIGRNGAATPNQPPSVFGQMTIDAPDIEQGGVVRAPLGQLTLGTSGGGFHGLDGTATQTVTLLPGSITSISGAGLSIPYGGTPDGVNYSYNGTPINPAIALTGLTVEAISIDDQAGSTLDVSGGGAVQGAAFIPGRGGSVDVLKTPLVNANPKNLGAATDKVYAIVAGYDTSYAPISPDKGFGDPNIGQQVTIPAGVPGLPAGTYTLLPSTYALLPGGYRVEVGKAAPPSASGVSAVGNNTYAAIGYTSIANTGVRSALPSTLLVSSGAAVRDYTQYNEQSYSNFVVANQASFNSVQIFGLQILIPEDAKTLNLLVDGSFDPRGDVPAFRFKGVALTGAAEGGSTGAVNVRAGDFAEVYSDAPTDGFAGISFDVADLNAIKAPSLGLTGSSLTVRSGVTLQGAQLTLTADTDIDIQSGATLTTIGMGDAPSHSSVPFSVGKTTLALSNGELHIQSTTGTGSIVVEGGASLFAGGTLAFATNGASKIDSAAHFGAKDIALTVNNINIGDAADIAAAGNPDGLLFDQTLFNFLLAGDPLHGAPKLESLTLTTSGAVNLFGDASLDASGTGVDLVLNTPAIYGFGGADAHATIAAGRITWNGLSGASPPTILDGGSGTGQGTLDLRADEIDFGQFKALDATSATRTIYGFGTVNLIAADTIVSAGVGALNVFQAPNSGAGAVFGQGGVGGALNIVTPLLASAQQSVMTYATGGLIKVSSPTGAPSTATSTVGGGEIDLNGDSVEIDSTILLPSGKLAINTVHDIVFDAGSRIDLAGRPSKIQDATVYSFGGSLVLSSTDGNVTQATGSVIDVSAIQADAGSIAITADAGAVTLNGLLKAQVDDGFTSGDFTLATDTLGDFAGLNASLNSGGFFDLRSFDLKSGDLVIGDGVKAHDVEISLDGGSLTVNGTIDASGAKPGIIRLAGKTGLTLAGSAVLDAHGTVLQVDSYGAPIEAKNRGEVELAVAQGSPTQGVLTLASGATIDLSTPDGVARGQIELDARRTDETGGDIAIDASGPLNIRGAGSIAVNAFWTYSPTDTYGTIVQDNGDLGGATVNADGWLGMNQIDLQSQAFMTAAANGGVQARLAGLKDYGAAFHLRPGVEIDSNTPDGNLTVAGDIDLASFRYGADADRNPTSATYGRGEPGALVIRAGGDLDIVGSISDGFQAAPSTPDDSGWLLQNGKTLTGDVETLLPVTLNSGTTFPNTAGLKLRYDIQVDAASVKANVALPIAMTLLNDYTVPAGTRLSAAVLDSGGDVLFPAGTVITTATVLPGGSKLAAGSVMPTTFFAAGMTWPAGTPLDVFGFAAPLAAPVTVPFEGVIPAGTSVVLSTTTAPTRPADASGAQGLLLAIAPMLPGGGLSWSIRGVAGADLDAADTRVVKPASLLKSRGISGNITLVDSHFDKTSPTSQTVKKYFWYYNDYPNRYYSSSPTDFACTHYGNTSCGVTYGTQITPAKIWGGAPSVLRTGTGDLDLIAGGSFDEQTLFGVYTAGTQSAPILASDGSDPYQQPRGLLGSGTTVLDAGKDVAIDAIYQAWYPDHGGDVLISAQGDVGGKVVMPDNQTSFTNSDLVSQWLWKQGGGGVATQPTAWWINFGTFAQGSSFNKDSSFVGFQGVGTLGGGNLTVVAGGNAGTSVLFGGAVNSALNLAVASTGRVLADGAIVQTGGGDLTLKVGGKVNPGVATTSLQVADAYGLLADLRGDINVTAGAYGDIGGGLSNTNNQFYVDPRAAEPGVNQASAFYPGPTVVPGDGKVKIEARGDLALGGVGDATLILSIDGNFNGSAYDRINPDGSTTFVPSGGATNFTLWRPTTSIDLFSSGGDVAPTTGAQDSSSNAQMGFYPGTLLVAAANGDVRFQGGGIPLAGGQALELIPSPVGQLEILAAGSIYGSGQVLAMSGASMDSLATPQHPAFTGQNDPVTGVPLTNASSSSPYVGGNFKGGHGNPIAFGPDTPTGDLHAGDDKPALIYAGVDIDDLELGQVQQQTSGFGTNAFRPVPTTWYIAAKPFEVVAGRDIVGTGMAQSAFLNLSPGDITEIHAGRDIIFELATIAGPGLLDVQAGRDVFQGLYGSLESVGPLFDVDPTQPSGGAGIAIAAGTGPDGPDYADFAKLYFDAANQLPGDGTPLADSGKVVHAYDKELLAWLQQRFGYTGSADGALTYFLALPSVQQGVFVRQVYYEELTLGGREFNDPTSSRFNSYLRGRDAIATLFPTQDANGKPIAYDGTLTMYSGLYTNPFGKTVIADAAIRTDFGGDVQILNPGGQTILGVEGLTPGSLAGLLTQGEGDIDIYSEGSILLGQSRILTTFGGDILAWSASGDINSGRGSKTSIIFTPPRRVYDAYGNVTLSSPVPATGAGVGTLNPIPEVPPGDVDLVAPLGTVDAGEAGIRVSGDINIAALHVVNAANIQVQGNATGLPQAVVVNTGALTSASNAASAVSTEAERLAERARPQMVPQAAPVILTVKLLGFGENP